MTGDAGERVQAALEENGGLVARGSSVTGKLNDDPRIDERLAERGLNRDDVLRAGATMRTDGEAITFPFMHADGELVVLHSLLSERVHP